jgi:hypothetical protein
VLSSGQTCSNTGKTLREDKWYCGHHDPAEISRRQAVRSRKWQMRLESVQAAGGALTQLVTCSDCKDAALAELARLVDALQHFEVDGYLPIPGIGSLRSARDVLARARSGVACKAARAKLVEGFRGGFAELDAPDDPEGSATNQSDYSLNGSDDTWAQTA